MHLETATKDGLLSLGLNQDHGCFSCGLNTGLRVYNTDPVKELHRHDFSRGVAHVEMLFRCCYLALVGGGHTPQWSNNKIVVWHDQNQTAVCEVVCEGPVLTVRLKRDRIIAVLLNSVQVYTLEPEPKLLSTIQTCPNPLGLCEVCPVSNVMVTLSTHRGQVSLVEFSESVEKVRTIPAHTTPLSALSLNMQGTMLATASQKGTIVRVFDSHTCLLLWELRRGSNNAIIYSIAFNKASTLLCVTSDSKTLHVFELLEQKDKQSMKLPKYFSPSRSLTKFTLPSKSPSICCFGAEERTVIVLTSEGFYYKIRWNEKGEALKEEQFKFLMMTDD